MYCILCIVHVRALYTSCTAMYRAFLNCSLLYFIHCDGSDIILFHCFTYKRYISCYALYIMYCVHAFYILLHSNALPNHICLNCSKLYFICTSLKSNQSGEKKHSHASSNEMNFYFIASSYHCHTHKL